MLQLVRNLVLLPAVRLKRVLAPPELLLLDDERAATCSTASIKLFCSEAARSVAALASLARRMTSSTFASASTSLCASSPSISRLRTSSVSRSCSMASRSAARASKRVFASSSRRSASAVFRSASRSCPRRVLRLPRGVLRGHRGGLARLQFGLEFARRHASAAPFGATRRPAPPPASSLSELRERGGRATPRRQLFSSRSARVRSRCGPSPRGGDLRVHRGARRGSFPAKVLELHPRGDERFGASPLLKPGVDRCTAGIDGTATTSAGVECGPPTRVSLAKSLVTEPRMAFITSSFITPRGWVLLATVADLGVPPRRPGRGGALGG